jgi:hypothetical protein
MCRYIFMAMYSFIPPFREAKFCGVPSCVFEKLGCAAGEKKVAKHWSRLHGATTQKTAIVNKFYHHTQTRLLLEKLMAN